MFSVLLMETELQHQIVREPWHVPSRSIQKGRRGRLTENDRLEMEYRDIRAGNKATTRQILVLSILKYDHGLLCSNAFQTRRLGKKIS